MSTHRARAEQVVARLRAEPDHDWHIARNADGGAAAEDFIRNARTRNEQRTDAEKDASRTAAARRVLAAMRATTQEI